MYVLHDKSTGVYIIQQHKLDNLFGLIAGNGLSITFHMINNSWRSATHLAFRTHKTGLASNAAFIRTYKKGQLTAEITNYIRHTHSQTPLHVSICAHWRTNYLLYMASNFTQHVCDCVCSTPEHSTLLRCVIVCVFVLFLIIFGNMVRWLETEPEPQTHPDRRGSVSAGMTPLRFIIEHIVPIMLMYYSISTSQTNHKRSQKYTSARIRPLWQRTQRAATHPHPFGCYDLIIIVIITTPWHATQAHTRNHAPAHACYVMHTKYVISFFGCGCRGW